MTINGVILPFSTGTYQVARETGQTYVNGRLQPGAASSFAIVASIQPTSGRDLKNLPEGQHSEELRVVYTTTELKPRTPTTVGDMVTIDAEPWVVVRVERWEHWGTTHYRAYISRSVIP